MTRCHGQTCPIMGNAGHESRLAEVRWCAGAPSRMIGSEGDATTLLAWTRTRPPPLPCPSPSPNGSPGSPPTSVPRPPRPRGLSSASRQLEAARPRPWSPEWPGSWPPGPNRRRSRRSPSTLVRPRSCASGWRPRSSRSESPPTPSASAPSTPSGSRSCATPAARRASCRATASCARSSPMPTPPPVGASTTPSPA